MFYRMFDTAQIIEAFIAAIAVIITSIFQIIPKTQAKTKAIAVLSACVFE